MLSSQLRDTVRQVHGLLTEELDFLDRLLSVSQRLNETIKNRKQTDASEQAAALLAEQASVTDEMQKSRQSWLQLFPEPGHFREWCGKLPEAEQEPILQSRNLVRERMDQVRALNMGTQTLLVYTNNYYAKFLSAISPDGPSATRYSSTGQVKQPSFGSHGSEF